LDRTWSGYVDRVTVKSQTIEIDAETAALLESRAAERGISVCCRCSRWKRTGQTPGAVFYGNPCSARSDRPAQLCLGVGAALGFASEFTHYLLDRAVYRFSIRRCARRRAHS